MLRASNIPSLLHNGQDITTKWVSRGFFLKRLFTVSPVAKEVNVYRDEHPRVEAR